MQCSCLCPEPVPWRIRGPSGSPATPLAGGIRDGGNAALAVLQGYLHLMCLSCKQGCQFYPHPACIPLPQEPPAVPEQALRKGPQHLRQPPSPFSPHFPTSHPASGAGAGCRNRRTLFRAAMLRCWVSRPLPILLHAGVQSLGVSRLFTDIAIFCPTFSSFLLPFQSSKAFEVQL